MGSSNGFEPKNGALRNYLRGLLPGAVPELPVSARPDAGTQHPLHPSSRYHRQTSTCSVIER